MDYFEKHKGGERAILVHLDIRQMQDPDDLGEFELLADSAGADRYALVTGSRMKPDAKYFVGSGKAQEIAELVREHDADIVLLTIACRHHKNVTLKRWYSVGYWIVPV